MSTYWYILGIPAQRQGQSFVDALLAPNAIQDIPGGERFGLRVMPDFPLIPIRSKIRRDIVFRQAVQDFWLECIRNTDILHHRVCALGTSEVGQTKATVQLFSLLLQQQRTVVYRSHDYLWYFEFRPVPSNDDSRDGSAATGTTAYPQAQPKYVCTVYPSKYTADKDILSLRDPNTYYIVDHSFRPDEVRPIERNIPARLIIVAPPRSVFWGDEGFSKASDDCGSCTNGGIFVVHPPWTLDELLLARPYLNKNFVREPFGDTPPLSEDDVKARFYIFGGVPGRIFCDTVSRNLLLSLQRRYATDPMDIEKVSNILSGKADPIHWEDQRERTSSLLLTLTPNGSDFIDYLSTPASLGVAFQLMTNFRDELGAEVERHNDNSLFEPYAAYLLGHKVKEVQARPCVAPTDAAAYKDYQTIRLGGYQQVEYAPDIAAQAIQRPNVLFMSTTRLAYPFCTDQKQLIDFVYSKIVNGKIHVHAFKATLGVQYDMDETQMMRLMEQLERAGVDSASLYFLVCPPEFDKFGTNPPSPSAHYGLDNARTQLFLYHVKVIDAYHTVAVEDDNE
jgi:hypothetical protein